MVDAISSLVEKISARPTFLGVKKDRCWYPLGPFTLKTVHSGSFCGTSEGIEPN